MKSFYSQIENMHLQCNNFLPSLPFDSTSSHSASLVPLLLLPLVIVCRLLLRYTYSQLTIIKTRGQPPPTVSVVTRAITLTTPFGYGGEPERASQQPRSRNNDICLASSLVPIFMRCSVRFFQGLQGGEVPPLNFLLPPLKIFTKLQ